MIEFFHFPTAVTFTAFVFFVAFNTRSMVFFKSTMHFFSNSRITFSSQLFEVVIMTSHTIFFVMACVTFYIECFCMLIMEECNQFAFFVLSLINYFLWFVHIRMFCFLDSVFCLLYVRRVLIYMTGLAVSLTAPLPVACQTLTVICCFEVRLA